MRLMPSRLATAGMTFVLATTGVVSATTADRSSAAAEDDG